MRFRPSPLPLVLFLLAFPASARDRTVGMCTLRDKFAKAQEALDPRIRELTGAKSEKEKVKLGRKLAAKYGKGPQIECLIRYREPDLKYVFLPLLEASKWPVRARALYGLKMVGDEGVVPAVAKVLRDKDAKVRELAANCLCRIATEVPGELTKALEREKDRFAKASMEAAVRVIEAGGKPYDEWAEKIVGPEGARRVEWAWTVKGATSFNRYDARTLEYPEADSFDWPISWYEGSLFASVPRKSFGAGGNHAGEDMAWFREGASMYAIANGIVRMEQGAGGDWGFLIALEHRLPNGEYVMSVYGHAGFDLLVKPGDVVKKGQAIATVGMSCAVENGGYGAHLHFGISQGPFRRPRDQRKGGFVNLNVDGKKQRGEIVRLAYDPSRKDPKYGFPALGLVVRFPDGAERLLPAPQQDIATQVSWLKGYVPDCVGWHDPRTFIEAHRK
jgi:murein DD-endopeptidase MepM/ murein hydrolase activator NlpD